MQLHAQFVRENELAGEDLRLARSAWRWRELLQRAMDGSHASHAQSAAGLAAYADLPGPFLPLPCGFQVSAAAVSACAAMAVSEAGWGHAWQR